MPAWVETAVTQLWSFLAVALAVNALGTVSKRIATKLGWRRYRSSEVAALLATYRDAPREISSGGVALPTDASWYDITLRLHPLVAGALFGLLPLPALNVIDALGKEGEASAYLAARCAWFMLAGALSGQVYEAVKFAFSTGRARILALVGRTPAPAAPAGPYRTAAPKDTEPTTPAPDDEEPQ